MRVLHFGNVANNGYLNAKLQRRAGVEADAVCDELDAINQPEWEDGDEPGWVRPDWVLPVRQTRQAFPGHFRLLALAGLAGDIGRVTGTHAQLNGAGGVRRRDILAGLYWMQQFKRMVGSLRPLFDRYDVVQAYATYPILPLLVGSSRPYVAFEHGTMREIPFEDSFLGRLLRLAYRRADKVVITNADVLGAARKLGLTNYVFVPHPVDEAKYCPGESGFRAELGAEADDLVCFSPSRHDWDIKGNDRMLQAFAELVRAGRSTALLAVNEWGADVARSRALVRSLGVEGRIRWLPPLPKRKLIDAYRGADVVLDQFEIGTFGAVAPEAMACGAPVVMAFNAALHEWCFPEQPPVRAARTPTEILQALTALAGDPAERVAIGARGRAWVEHHHSSRTVVERQLAVYDEVVKDGRGDSAAARPRAG